MGLAQARKQASKNMRVARQFSVSVEELAAATFREDSSLLVQE